MARTWLAVTVELLGGRGEDLWPYPGRTFAVGPSHTFAALAGAINTAFARWDLSHLSVFDLDDGSLVTDAYTIREMGGSGLGRITRSYDFERVKVSTMVRPGDEFRFTFDLGDNWVHACRVEEVKVDPMETLGIRPSGPLPFWGWGAIPDQYGRRTSDDDGERRLPRRPAQPHPMRSHGWPAEEDLEPIDLAEVRAAITAGAVSDYLDEITGKNIMDVLQQVAQGLPMALATGNDESQNATASIYNSLTWRGLPGDAELAEDLLARLRGEELSGPEIHIKVNDLMLAAQMALLGDLRVDAAAGRVSRAEEGPPETSGRSVVIPGLAADDREELVAEFVDTLPDDKQKERFERYANGEKEFVHFLSAIDREGLNLPWQDFSTEHAIARIRCVLAEQGLRLGH